MVITASRILVSMWFHPRLCLDSLKASSTSHCHRPTSSYFISWCSFPYVLGHLSSNVLKTWQISYLFISIVSILFSSFMSAFLILSILIFRQHHLQKFIAITRIFNRFLFITHSSTVGCSVNKDGSKQMW